MRELAFLNKGLSIILIDKTSKKEKEYKNKYDGGIQEFVEFLDKNKETLVNKNDLSLFKKPIYISGLRDSVEVECSLKWNAGYSEDIFPYTNNSFRIGVTGPPGAGKSTITNLLIRRKNEIIWW